MSDNGIHHTATTVSTDCHTKVIGGFPMNEEDRGAALFREHVATMKQNILSVVQSEVVDFRRRTGIEPHAIDIEMVNGVERYPADIRVRFHL